MIWYGMPRPPMQCCARGKAPLQQCGIIIRRFKPIYWCVEVAHSARLEMEKFHGKHDPRRVNRPEPGRRRRQRAELRPRNAGAHA
jgi:hypothetical protein